MVNVISQERYKELEPKIKENKVCLTCWREFKKPIKTKDREGFTRCQKCINAINNFRF